LDCAALPECHKHNTFDRNELKEEKKKNLKNPLNKRTSVMAQGTFLHERT
jgi:hypothetical protein